METVQSRSNNVSQELNKLFGNMGRPKSQATRSHNPERNGRSQIQGYRPSIKHQSIGAVIGSREEFNTTSQKKEKCPQYRLMWINSGSND